MKKKWSLKLPKRTPPSPAKESPVQSTEVLTERTVNLITPGTVLEGKIHFDRNTRMAGRVQGSVEASPGTILIVTNEGLVEGDIQGDHVIIQGFVEGEVHAKTKIQIASGGRVIGNLNSPSVQVDFGAWFEGECHAGRNPEASPPSV